MTFDANKTIVARLKRRVIPNWRSRLSDFSTIALALSASIIALWSTLPADWLAHLPTAWVARATGAISLFGLCGKFLQQGKPNDSK